MTVRFHPHALERMAREAVTIDGQKVTDSNAQITPKAGMTIQVGKRKFARLKVT